jgi:hypothetical protein
VFGAETPETSHLAFVTEYVRELAAVEDIRAAAEQELKQAEKQDVLANVVYTSTRMQLELRTQINSLKGMRLKPPFEELIPNLTAFYQRKLELYKMLCASLDRGLRRASELTRLCSPRMTQAGCSSGHSRARDGARARFRPQFQLHY